MKFSLNQSVDPKATSPNRDADSLPLDLLNSYFNRIKAEVRPKKQSYFAAEMVAMTT
jgi:hypothetical protein